MRIGAVPDLSLRHIKKWQSENVYQFTVYEKTREEYSCFCTPECARSIDEYLAYRTRVGESLGPDSPLIRDDFDPLDKSSVCSPRRTTVPSLRSHISRLAIAAGIREKSNSRKRKEIMILHSMRKFYNTQLVKADVNFIVKEMLLGHAVRLDSVYFTLRMRIY